MNIGIIVDNDFNNDIRVRKEVGFLVKHGFNVFVLCLGYDNKKYENIQEVTFYRININQALQKKIRPLYHTFPIYPFLIKKYSLKFIKRFNISIIHTHDLYMSLPIRKAIDLSGRKVKLILDLHENYPAAIKTYSWADGKFKKYLVYPSLWQKKEWQYLNAADKIIVLSKPYRNQLLKKHSFLNESQFLVFPNTINFEEFDSFKINEKLKKDKRFTLLYFGVVAKRRGIFDTIEMLEAIESHKNDILLYIIGPVDNADKKKFSLYKKRAIQNGCNIVYKPWIPLSDLLSYLKITDVCLSPLHINEHHNSGVANKIYQYMYGAKPIVASACIPQMTLINESQCGEVFRSIEEYKEAILKLYNNREHSKKLGLNGKAYLHKHYNNKLSEDKLINFYKNLDK